jgi:hypothetical protein
VNIHAPGSPPDTKTVSAMFTRQRSEVFLFHSALNDHVQSRSVNVPSSIKDESFITSFDGIAAVGRSLNGRGVRTAPLQAPCEPPESLSVNTTVTAGSV